MVISSREIFYQSSIHLTPLTADGAIDGQAVAQIVANEYCQAGIERKDVQSGAVIITGETARLRNAPQVVEALSKLAGDFVVASAGPRLESILAARGSGAAQKSLENKRTILNIDIGGGTTNLAVFASGELLDAACIGIGGRFLMLSQDRHVISITESGELFMDAIAKRTIRGEQVSHDRLKHYGQLLGEALIQATISHRPPQIARRLYITEPLNHEYSIDEYWFSGGVAEFMQAPPKDPLMFQDMGAYLASGLVESLSAKGVAYTIAPLPIRATVIGAGLHSLQLSGSTISVSNDTLPLNNLPLIRPFTNPLENQVLSKRIKKCLSDCLSNHDLNWSLTPLAIVLDRLPNTDYEALNEWASGLVAAYTDLQGTHPLVVVVTDDVAMALGQLMRAYLPNEKLIVLDGISLSSGDYIDIGSPLAGGQVLPVVIKSLVFQY